jgi:hypothetical protein
MRARKGMSAAIAMLALCSLAAGQPRDQKPAPRLDPKATEVLRQMCDYFKSVKGLSVDISRTLTMTVGGKTGEITCPVHLAVRRPNFAAVSWERGGAQAVPITGTLACDGKTLYVLIPLLKQYTAGKAPADLGALFSSKDAIPLVADAPLLLDNLFANDPYESVMEGAVSTSYVGTEEVAGAKCHCVKIAQDDGEWELWVAAGDRPLILKAVLDATKSLKRIQRVPADAQMKLVLRFEKWAINPDLTDDRFAFVPPEGARKVASFSEPEERATVPRGK